MSWRTMTYTLLLFVFIVAIDRTRGNCKESVALNNWKDDLMGNVSLRKPKDPRDIMECTVEQECKRNNRLCDLLFLCFKDNTSDEKSKEISKKCEGEIFSWIYLYHFLCLTARAFNHTPTGCSNYEMVCRLYSDSSSLYATTTALPKPTAMLTATPTALHPNASTATANETTQQEAAISGRISGSNADNNFWKHLCVGSLVVNALLIAFLILPFSGITKRIHSCSTGGNALGFELQQLSNSYVAVNRVDCPVEDEVPQ